MATKEARRFSVEKRNCYFPDEVGGNYEGAYSQQECLTRCRCESVQKLCNCRPFNIPANKFSRNNESWPACNLADMECLQRFDGWFLKRLIPCYFRLIDFQFSVTWNTFRPVTNTKIPIPAQLDEVLQESIDCSQCVPLCSYKRYYFSKSWIKLENSKANEKIL